MHHRPVRLRFLDPPQPVVRYEHAEPGDLLHLDVKQAGPYSTGRRRITGDRPAPGSTRRVGVRSRRRRRPLAIRLRGSPRKRRRPHHHRLPEVRLDLLPPPRVRIRRVLTENAKTYGSDLFTALCGKAGIQRTRTRPYRPCTNGKAERFIQTMLREWAYQRAYTSSRRRTAALPRWLDRYNFRRPHGSLGRRAPITRVVTQQ